MLRVWVIDYGGIGFSAMIFSCFDEFSLVGVGHVEIWAVAEGLATAGVRGRWKLGSFGFVFGFGGVFA